MSTIKGTPKHNKGSILEFVKKGRSPKIQTDNSENSKSSVRERGEIKNKIRKQRKRTSSHILETL